MAEEVGFEPTEGFHLRRFSRPVHSTTLPPLRCFCCGEKQARIVTMPHCFSKRFRCGLTIAEVVVAVAIAVAIAVTARAAVVTVAVAISIATAVAVVVTAAVVLPIAASAAVALPLWAFGAIRARGFHAFKRVAVFVGERLFVACAATLLLLRLCLLLAVRALLAILPLRCAIALLLRTTVLLLLTIVVARAITLRAFSLCALALWAFALRALTLVLRAVWAHVLLAAIGDGFGAYGRVWLKALNGFLFQLAL